MKKISLSRVRDGRVGRHGTFFGLEFLIQLIIFVGGISVLRLLPKPEYALYFSLTSVSQMASVIGDSGLSSGFFKLAGPSVNDKETFSNIFATFVKTRSWIRLVVVPVLLPVGWSVLYRQHSPVIRILDLLFLFLVLVSATLLQTIHLDALRILGKFNRIQTCRLWVEIGRSVALVCLIRLFPRAETTLLVVVVSTLIYSYLLERICHDLGVLGGKSDNKYRVVLMQSFRRLLPNSVYYAFQGQISPILLAWFSQSTAVADLGAITRLGRTTDILNSYISNVVGPRSARCVSKGEFVRFASMVLVGSLAVVVVMVASSVFCSSLLLKILGSGYHTLNKELFAYSFALSLSFLIAVAVNINQGRGWIAISSVWQVPVSVCGMIAGIYLFGAHSTLAVIWLGFTGRLPVIVVQLLDTRRGFLKGFETAASAPLVS